MRPARVKNICETWAPPPVKCRAQQCEWDVVNKIVLGQPYSGALLGFFSDQIGQESSHTRAQGHPYYRALFGPNYKALIDLSLTFLLLYDEVWICPADSFWPEPRTDLSSRGYIHELALNAPWERFVELGELGRPWHEIFRHDQMVMKILQHIGYDFDAWDQVIESAMFDMAVAKDQKCAILCSPEQRQLIERLLVLQKAAIHTSFSDFQEIEFVSSYNKVTGLAFKSNTIDDLLDVKSDPDLRVYSRSFLDVARTVAESSQRVTDGVVARLMLEAINSKATAKVAGGVLNWAGSVFRPLHDPLISGSIALGGVAAAHIGAQASWFQFEGTINNALRMRDIVRNLEIAAKEGRE